MCKYMKNRNGEKLIFFYFGEKIFSIKLKKNKPGFAHEKRSAIQKA